MTFYEDATSMVSRWECFACGRAQPMQHLRSATPDDLVRLAQYQHGQRIRRNGRGHRPEWCGFRSENVAIAPYPPRRAHPSEQAP